MGANICRDGFLSEVLLTWIVQQYYQLQLSKDVQ